MFSTVYRLLAVVEDEFNNCQQSVYSANALSSRAAAAALLLKASEEELEKLQLAAAPLRW